jgi:Ca2+-binding RTX toxin-like protein
MAEIQGTLLDDILVGTTGDDVIEARDGKDKVNAGLGNDIVYGGLGNDAINGEAGNDTLHGEDGNDTLTGDAGDDVIFGGSGNDGVFGGGSNDTIHGETGTDTLYGDGGNDVIDGGADNDKLYGGAGDDQLIGGLGDDLVNGDAGNDTFIYRAGDGVDTVNGGLGTDTVVLQISGADLTPALKADLAAYLAWQSSNVAAAGTAATLAGQSSGGTFTFASLGLTISTVESLSVLVDGAAAAIESLLNAAPLAAETVSFSGSEDVAVTGTLSATDADGDTLAWSVTSGPANGSISLDGATGAFTYAGNPNYSGADSFVVTVSDGNGGFSEQRVDIALAAVADGPLLVGNDFAANPSPLTIAGTKFAETLSGSAGSDEISAGSGDDVIWGDGNSVMTAPLVLAAALTDTDGSEELTVLVGGLGNGVDLSAGVWVDSTTKVLTAAELAGLEVTSSELGTFTLTVTAVTHETGGGSASTATTVSIDFGSGADSIRGGKGNDTIHAGFGDDTVRGDSGNDTIFGDAGNDALTGDAGNDVIHDGSGNDSISGGSGNDIFMAGAGDDVYSGGRGFDTLDFSAASSALSIDVSQKTVTGLGVDKVTSVEKIIGSAHSDDYKGSSAADQFDGSAGSDSIRGLGGADTLTGGDGDDTFVWFGKDVVSGKKHLGVDHITDFAVGDRIDLHEILKGSTAPIDNLVRVDDAADGAHLSAKLGGTFVEIAVLDDVHGVTAASLFADGALLI